MKRAVRILSLALVGVLVLAMTAACSNKDVIAIVNGKSISKSEIDTQLAQLKTSYPQLFSGADGKQRESEFRTRLLDNSINQVLVEQEATKQGITVSDADIQKEVDALKKRFPTDAAFQDALKKNNMTVDKLKEQEKVTLLTQRLMEKVSKGGAVTDAAMKDYFKQNPDMFTDKAAVHAKHILFDEKDKATAEKVLAQLKTGGDFAALAKQYSKDPGSAAKGGDLGWPSVAYVPEFQKAIDTGAVNKLIPNLIHTTYGWHIIFVIEKRKETVKTFDAVKDQIKQILLSRQQSESFQKLLDELKKKAKIEYPNGAPTTAVPSLGTTGTAK
jgi:foldase protein PrsA